MTVSASQNHPLTSELFAAIDLGSNSFRLETARISAGRYRKEFYVKETVRLGAGLDAGGCLTQEAVARAMDCLEAFALHLKGFDDFRIRAVATQTLREASNRDEFLEQAQEVLGVPIEVISGREEARLIFTGVSHLQSIQEPTLVADIGGRSTELILGQNFQAWEVESFPVGSVSLALSYFPSGVLTRRAFYQAKTAVAAQFEEATQAFGSHRWTQVLGTSGTVNAVFHILQANGFEQDCIDRSGIEWLLAQCIEAGSSERLNFAGLKDDRRPVLAGGLAVLMGLFDQFDIEELRPAKGSLRQGVIVELDARLRDQAEHAFELRDRTITQLQRRFTVDADQAMRVRRVCQELIFSALGPIDAESVREMSWACDLHEIGSYISHHDHHRHSAYILSHVEAPGFSQSQMRRLGRLVLSQRGGLRKIEQDLRNTTFAWMVLCLRLAVIVCHSRRDLSLSGLRLRRLTVKEAVVTISDLKSSQHDTLLHLLRDECEHWVRSGVLRVVLEVS